MHIGVIGINHKLADVELRERLAKACQRRFGAGQSAHPDHTFLLLSTCNRTEVYFSSRDLPQTHCFLLSILRQDVEQEFDQKVYSYFGEDCFLHLARVTAGLDSAIVAETEIQGQVKTAYENAVEYIQLPMEMHYLFQKSLKIGKDVRSTLLLGRGMPDLEHAVLNAGLQLFKSPEEPRVLFIGASSINEKILSFLKSKEISDVTICNRSVAHARELADRYALNQLGWQELNQWYQYNWIIVGTKASDYLLKRSDLPENDCRDRLIVDLSVPRNVDPMLGQDVRTTLLNIDSLNQILHVRKQRMLNLLEEADRLVLEAAKKQVDLFREKERSRLRILAVSA